MCARASQPLSQGARAASRVQQPAALDEYMDESGKVSSTHACMHNLTVCTVPRSMPITYAILHCLSGTTLSGTTSSGISSSGTLDAHGTPRKLTKRTIERVADFPHTLGYRDICLRYPQQPTDCHDRRFRCST